MLRARPTIRGVRSGLSMGTRSVNGNGRWARCFGFTANVRISLSPLSPVFISGSVLQQGQEKLYFRAHHSILPLSPQTHG
jgi:hypothetical protein